MNMKKKYIYLLLTLAACSGQIDENDNTQEIPDEYTAPFVLTADKTEVEASGKDLVTFSLNDAYGRDLLDDKRALQNVTIMDGDGIVIPRMTRTAGYITNGNWTYTATFKGQKSENELTITSKNRTAYELFHKNIGIYKATATWCTACPAMTAAIEGINEEAKRHSINLCCHSGDQWAIEHCGAEISHKFGGDYLPTVVLDLNHAAVIPATSKNSTVIENTIRKIRTDYPATCGIRLSTSVESGKVNMTAELMSSTGGDYDLGFALLLNNQIFVDAGTGSEKPYTHIVQDITDNFMSLKKLHSVEKNGKIEFKDSFVLPVGIDDKNLSIVAYAIVPDGKDSRIDNIVEVNVGESIEYVYNE